MDAENWLLLTDYASKYRISVSTLRRRIKSHQIPFRFEHGKYLILDHAAPEAEMPSVANVMKPAETHFKSAPQTFAAEAAPIQQTAAVSKASVHTLPETQKAEVELEEVAGKDGPLISTATKLLNELKRAYMNILQEKEGQMLDLKREVSDLKTLVRVLEDENQRLNSLLGFRNPLS